MLAGATIAISATAPPPTPESIPGPVSTSLLGRRKLVRETHCVDIPSSFQNKPSFGSHSRVAQWKEASLLQGRGSGKVSARCGVEQGADSSAWRQQLLGRGCRAEILASCMERSSLPEKIVSSPRKQVCKQRSDGQVSVREATECILDPERTFVEFH